MGPVQVAVTPTQPLLAAQVRAWVRGTHPLRSNPQALRSYEGELSDVEVFSRRHPELVRLEMYVEEMRSALIEDEEAWVDRVLALMAEEVAAQQRARELIAHKKQAEAPKRARRKG
jgi:hypothetical protein